MYQLCCLLLSQNRGQFLDTGSVASTVTSCHGTPDSVGRAVPPLQGHQLVSFVLSPPPWDTGQCQLHSSPPEDTRLFHLCCHFLSRDTGHCHPHCPLHFGDTGQCSTCCHLLSQDTGLCQLCCSLLFSDPGQHWPCCPLLSRDSQQCSLCCHLLSRNTG